MARVEQANDHVKLAEAMSCLDVAENLIARQKILKITDQQNSTQIDSSVDCNYILPPASAEAIEQVNAYGEIIIDNNDAIEERQNELIARLEKLRRF